MAVFKDKLVSASRFFNSWFSRIFLFLGYFLLFGIARILRKPDPRHGSDSYWFEPESSNSSESPYS